MDKAVSGGLLLSWSATGRAEASLYFLWTDRRRDMSRDESVSPANAQDLTAEIAVVVLDSAPSTLIGHRAERQPLRTSTSGCFFQNKRWEFDVMSICLVFTRDKKIFTKKMQF